MFNALISKVYNEIAINHHMHIYHSIILFKRKNLNTCNILILKKIRMQVIL